MPIAQAFTFLDPGILICKMRGLNKRLKDLTAEGWLFWALGESKPFPLGHGIWLRKLGRSLLQCIALFASNIQCGLNVTSHHFLDYGTHVLHGSKQKRLLVVGGDQLPLPHACLLPPGPRETRCCHFCNPLLAHQKCWIQGLENQETNIFSIFSYQIYSLPWFCLQCKYRGWDLVTVYPKAAQGKLPETLGLCIHVFCPLCLYPRTK